MKITKEISAILSALYCLEQKSEPRNEEKMEIINYALSQLLGINAHLYLRLSCVGKTYDEMLDEVYELLRKETDFRKEY